jgi:YHS domain-containing protein
MKKTLLFLSAMIITAYSLFAQKSETFIESGKAIRGYDPVAYFTEAKPVKGSEKFVYTWNNANWYFSSQQNLELFKANPEKYAPQYGGYCAYGLSEGHKAPTDANAWTIVNEKLYLNYNLDVKKEWSKDRPQRIEKANENWPKVKGKE